MGKRLIQQARGKGSSKYRAPSFRYKGKVKHSPLTKQQVSGTVVEIINCQGHSAPLAKVKDDEGKTRLIIAPEGLKIGTILKEGTNEIAKGNTVMLKDLPEGSQIFNVESTPGDGGKYCRSSGTSAKLVSHMKGKVIVQFPSKKQKILHPQCRANIGNVAGSGRRDKPILKAGINFYRKKAKNKLYPIVSGSAMNAVDHPFGNKRTSRKSKARPTPRNAPPGRKVGMIAAKRTGRRVQRVKTEVKE
tara:strand:+ start:4933 stop:5670 length:738 start_codon:yes stop_codon:yes gene_type:complete